VPHVFSMEIENGNSSKQLFICKDGNFTPTTLTDYINEALKDIRDLLQSLKITVDSIKKDVAYEEDDGDYDDDAWHSLSDSAEDDFKEKKSKKVKKTYDPRFDFHPLRYPNQQ
jgi:enamine deaminase RidA (YjgF/YER057c/UK114 family)